MPPVKKNLKNGFNFYMDDYIPELRRQGIVIDHKQEAVPYLLADWKALRNVVSVHKMSSLDYNVPIPILASRQFRWNLYVDTNVNDRPVTG